jgi:phosphoglycolate phosphatase
VGHGARRLIEDSMKAAGDENAVRIEEGMEAYGRIFKENCTYKVAPYEGIEKMLEELKSLGVRLAVLSNKPHLQTKDVVKTFFKEGTFVCVQGQQAHIPRKPDPTGIYQVLEVLGVAKEECIYIGDSDVDMDTGKAAGVATIGVTWGFRTKEVLEAHQATYIVEKPEEIISIVKGAE